MSRPAVLTIVRHGQTVANVDGVWHGSTDTPLTPLGQRQAARVAEWLHRHHPEIGAVYTSDLQRAHDTARAIGAALTIVPRVDRALREYDLGAWEGVSFRELWERHRLWERMREDPHHAPHGGESPRAVTTRFVDALQRIAAAHPGERVVVVTHGGALSMALGHLLDGDYTRWDRVMGNCTVSELVLDPSPELLRFAVCEHLDGLDDV
jgi:probable phosphoglycerate mutase